MPCLCPILSYLGINVSSMFRSPVGGFRDKIYTSKSLLRTWDWPSVLKVKYKMRMDYRSLYCKTERTKPRKHGRPDLEMRKDLAGGS